MEIIHKPQTPTTTILAIRVELAVKKELQRAREIAEHQGIDITAMFTAALADVARSILNVKSKASNNAANGIIAESLR